MDTLIWLFAITIFLFIGLFVYFRVLANRPQMKLIRVAPKTVDATKIIHDLDNEYIGIVLEGKPCGTLQNGLVKYQTKIRSGGEIQTINYFGDEIRLANPANQLFSGSPAIYIVSRKRGDTKDEHGNETAELIRKLNSSQRAIADLTANESERLDEVQRRIAELMAEKRGKGSTDREK
jgi:hypothetical protein